MGGGVGGGAGVIFNAANEVAVAAFLERRCRFGRIVELVEQTLNEVGASRVDCLDAVLDADRRAREHTSKLLARE